MGPRERRAPCGACPAPHGAGPETDADRVRGTPAADTRETEKDVDGDARRLHGGAQHPLGRDCRRPLDRRLFGSAGHQSVEHARADSVFSVSDPRPDDGLPVRSRALHAESLEAGIDEPRVAGDRLAVDAARFPGARGAVARARGGLDRMGNGRAGSARIRIHGASSGRRADRGEATRRSFHRALADAGPAWDLGQHAADATVSGDGRRRARMDGARRAAGRVSDRLDVGGAFADRPAPSARRAPGERAVLVSGSSPSPSVSRSASSSIGATEISPSSGASPGPSRWRGCPS